MAPQREWFEKDYYAILGVPETATAKEIKSAYRKLSRQFHPDANAGDAKAEERFKEISAAYDVVGDEAKRKEYDEVRRLGPVGGGFGGGGPGGFTFTTDNLGDLGDLFGNLFNRGRGRGRGRDDSTVGPATWRRSRDRAAAVVRGSGARCHHLREPHERRRVPHLPRHRRQAGHDAAASARVVAAAGSSTTTRASSRSVSRARSAVARERSSKSRARRVAGPVPSCVLVRSRCGSQRACKTGSASG